MIGIAFTEDRQSAGTLLANEPAEPADADQVILARKSRKGRSRFQSRTAIVVTACQPNIAGIRTFAAEVDGHLRIVRTTATANRYRFSALGRKTGPDIGVDLRIAERRARLRSVRRGPDVAEGT